jgi:hypothetical protein
MRPRGSDVRFHRGARQRRSQLFQFLRRFRPDPGWKYRHHVRLRSTFQFQITQPGGIDPADGIVFVLAASSTGLGSTGGDIGYGGVGHSIGIEFDTYNNGGADGNSSNHIAVNENGNIINGSSMSDQNLTNAYGVSTCDFGAATLYTANGAWRTGTSGPLRPPITEPI